DPVGLHPLAPARLARLRDEDEADALRGRLLVAGDGVDHPADVDRWIERDRQPVRGEDSLDLLAQPVGVGEPERGEQTEPYGLAVAIARVAGGGLDRMADRVPEIEDGTLARVALIAGDHLDLRPRAGEDHVLEALRIQDLHRADAVPELSARDQAG